MAASSGKGEGVDIKVVKRLLKLMEDAGLTELDVESEGVKVRLKKGGAGDSTVVVTPPLAAQQAVTAGAPVSSVSTAPKPGGGENPNRYTVKAPMVGTFYRAPSPQTPPFVNVGDVVSEGQTLCLIEAMKLMNELKSEKAGKVVRILAENGLPVEYNQPLIEIDLA